MKIQKKHTAVLDHLLKIFAVFINKLKSILIFLGNVFYYTCSIFIFNYLHS